MKTARAVRLEDGVIPRLKEESVTFFTPWGPRYDYEVRGSEIEDSHREIDLLKFLARILGEFKKNMPGRKFRWIFLGADLYGVKINHLPQ
ncbi:MAG TPA: hypothetical protein VI432_01310, partial [Candidatus Paceibacterota bacterium]